MISCLFKEDKAEAPCCPQNTVDVLYQLLNIDHILHELVFKIG